VITWLAPLAALFALSLPLIVILHMRHSRSQPLPITTMRFWAEATRHRRQRLALRRPPRSLLLFLQLLAAALIALALIRPAIPIPGLPGNAPPRQLIVLLDRSAAMRATDVAPSRFAAAKARARELVAGTATEEAVTLITLGADGRTFRSRDAGDRAALLAALDALGPGGGRADLNAALPLLRSVLLPERENRIVLLSGGTFAEATQFASFATLPATLAWERIGTDAGNLAITTLVVRRSAQSANRSELFARVANFSTGPVAARSIIDADGTEVDNRTLQIAAGGSVELVWQLPPDTRGARLRVNPTGGGADAMPFDNEAYVVTREVGQRRVLLVSDQPGDLGRALTAQQGVVITTTATSAYDPRQQYDLTVFDRFLPTTLPRGGILLVNPPANSTLIARTGSSETPTIARLDRESSVLAGIDLGGLTFPSTPISTLPTWATEIVGSERGPLILGGNFQGREIVALTFDPVASGLTRKIAFPLLIGNVVERLQTHRVPTTAPLGTGILLEPVAGTASVQLREPNGTTRTLELRESAGGAPSVYAYPDRPGLYALIERDASGTVILQESFAVNGGDPVSSNLRNVAAPLPPGLGGLAPPSANSTLSTTAQTETTVERRLGELWPVLLAIAAFFLLLEWLVGLGGLTPPRQAAERVKAPVVRR
jgi:Ca-activated chloride channel homolog